MELTHLDGLLKASMGAPRSELFHHQNWTHQKPLPFGPLIGPYPILCVDRRRSCSFTSGAKHRASAAVIIHELAHGETPGTSSSSDTEWYSLP